jgi:hypothetical protein
MKIEIGVSVRVMVSNATFNNISVLSWRSVLLAEETSISEFFINWILLVSRRVTFSHIRFCLEFTWFELMSCLSSMVLHEEQK